MRLFFLTPTFIWYYSVYLGDTDKKIMRPILLGLEIQNSGNKSETGRISDFGRTYLMRQRNVKMILRLQYAALFPDPCFLLCVPQNIDGLQIQNKMWLNGYIDSIKWRHLGHLQLLSKAK